MNLYEVTNGYYSESYVRVYVWTESEDQALNMAADNFGIVRGKKSLEPFWMPCDNMHARLLFSENAEPFCTLPSDTGFDDVPKLGTIAPKMGTERKNYDGNLSNPR